MSSTVFMAMLDNLAVNNALPSIGEELDVGVSGLQWVVASYTLIFAATLLSASVLGDWLGQRPAFLVGLLIFIAGSALGAIAPTWSLLVAGRLVQGAGAAVVMPASTALLRHTFTEDRRRARAMGVRGAAAGLGLALGPSIGGPLVDSLGWRSVMWINIPIGAVAFVLALRVLPRPPAVAARWDPIGQALAVTGLGSLVYALVQGPVDGWRAPTVRVTLVVAVLSLLAFVLVEWRGARPMLDLRLLRDRVCGAAAVAYFTASMGLFGGVFFLSIYLQDILGWSASGAGAVFLSASAFIVLAAPAAGALTGRYGARAPLTLGMALSALALLGLSRYGRDAAYADYWWLLPMLGTGAGLTFIPALVAVVQRSPVSRTGMASALMDALRELGGAVGVAALGAVLTARMRASLHQQAAASGLPSGQTHDLVDSVISQGPTAGFDAPMPAADPARLAIWVQQSFVDGLQLALRCGAAALACALAAVVLLLWGASGRGEAALTMGRHHDVKSRHQ
ncbi:DHA2 family efflux MFS transporter permease subunit [Streptomyces gobiensis]|uniref:DHA2 family efflux MFS transporter permease subunit n=1 Tax=Streptomyces gobiensis TaxID=2875706 RepID=UPI001E2C0BBA|nr:DHA2 family efflux MFS transporter permease subunit [Streptomyces gobiensis]